MGRHNADCRKSLANTNKLRRVWQEMRRNPVIFIYHDQFKRHKCLWNLTPKSWARRLCAPLHTSVGPLHTPRHGKIHSSVTIDDTAIMIRAVNNTNAGQLLQFPDCPIRDLWLSKLKRVCCTIRTTLIVFGQLPSSVVTWVAFVTN